MSGDYHRRSIEYNKLLHKMNRAETINMSPLPSGDDSLCRISSHDDNYYNECGHQQPSSRDNEELMMDASHAMLTLRDTPMAPISKNVMVTPSPAVLLVEEHPHRLEIQSLMELRGKANKVDPSTDAATKENDNRSPWSNTDRMTTSSLEDPMKHFENTIACLEQIKMEMEQERANAEVKLKEAKLALMMQQKSSTTMETNRAFMERIVE